MIITKPSEILPILQKITFFTGLPENILSSIGVCLQPRNYPAGTVIFNMGDPGDEMLLLESGSIAIFDPKSDGKPVRIFQPGDSLGEMALVERKPRSLSARAEQETHAWALRSQDFSRLIAENGDLGLAIMRSLSDRVRYTTDFLIQVSQWFKRVANGDYQMAEISQIVELYGNQSITALAAEFAQMVMQVKQREETLQQEVTSLRVQIDEEARKREVERITSTDRFKEMREEIKRMRAERKDR